MQDQSYKVLLMSIVLCSTLILSKFKYFLLLENTLINFKNFISQFNQMQFNFKSLINLKIFAACQEEFRLHFKNISRIMDCVGCDKCRLWGKLQVCLLSFLLKLLLTLYFFSLSSKFLLRCAHFSLQLRNRQIQIVIFLLY